MIEPDTVFAGATAAIAGVAVGAGAGAVEPEVEADVPTVDGVTAGAMDDAGTDARGNEP